jgi:hypothetical protein
MRKIYSFSKFNALYEVETSSGELNVAETEASKLYDQTLGLILTTILNSYSSELSFTADTYDKNIDPDIISIKNSPVLNKPAEFVEILKKVQKSAAVDNNLEGSKEAVDAWVAAGTKATEALTAMVNQYKDQPEEINHINDFVNAKLDSFLEEIQIAADENDLVVDESSSYKGLIFEGILQGKKSLIGDVSRQITLVSAKLFSLAQTPGMSTEIQRLQNEVTQISAKMGDLLQKSNKDINKEDIKKAATRLAEIPGEADKIAEKMLKEDSINKEASSILIQALVLVQVAIKAEKIYLQKKEQAIQKETGDAANAAERARTEKVKVKVEDYIEFDKDMVGKQNDEVKKVQQLIIDKFGDIEEIKDLPQYKEFSRFRNDGKFGPRTQEMIKIIQKGLDMEPSGNISPDFVYRVQTEDVVNESARSIFKFKEFNSLLESFKIKSAVEYAKKRPSYQKNYSGGGSSTGGSSTGGSSTGGSSTKFSKESAPKKWDWLGDRAKEWRGKNQLSNYSGLDSSDLIKLTWSKNVLNWDWLGVEYERTAECFYPVGDQLGKYQDVIFPYSKNFPVVVEKGVWGQGVSGKQDFKPEEYPIESKITSLDELLKEKENYWKTNEFAIVQGGFYEKNPIVRITTLQKWPASSKKGITFPEGHIVVFYGDGKWSEYKGDAKTRTDFGTWKIGGPGKLELTSGDHGGYQVFSNG